MVTKRHLSQNELIVSFLKENQGTRYTAKMIAKHLVETYPERYEEKRKKSNKATREEILQQVISEIGAHKEGLAKHNIEWEDRPRPRQYFYSEFVAEAGNPLTEQTTMHHHSEPITDTSPVLLEKDLYNLLMDYLTSELNLYCRRIDEKSSSNTQGSKGNKWLHPDIVAMEPVDRRFETKVSKILRQSGTSPVRLWSFEVKRELTMSNVRESFFQAVSNSSWANEGYLVTGRIKSSDPTLDAELRMLSSLHGIGVISLNTANPSESEIYLPAAKRPEVDWQSLNRLARENKDFANYISQVDLYITNDKHIEKNNWHQPK